MYYDFFVAFVLYGYVMAHIVLHLIFSSRTFDIVEVLPGVLCIVELLWLIPFWISKWQNRTKAIAPQYNAAVIIVMFGNSIVIFVTSFFCLLNKFL